MQLIAILSVFFPISPGLFQNLLPSNRSPDLRISRLSDSSLPPSAHALRHLGDRKRRARGEDFFCSWRIWNRAFSPYARKLDALPSPRYRLLVVWVPVSRCGSDQESMSDSREATAAIARQFFFFVSFSWAILVATACVVARRRCRLIARRPPS